ncbi:carbohydrate porin [Aristophania vespae]|uniref:carbohydrate porin n=1 Tax=Aristophania vespae TaxID=2697033 RepID=UPI00235133A7|nr:carbohydrate porin [Aristophania vespae]UMM64441.1 Porin B [Aristophania vespae]
MIIPYFSFAKILHWKSKIFLTALLLSIIPYSYGQTQDPVTEIFSAKTVTSSPISEKPAPSSVPSFSHPEALLPNPVTQWLRKQGINFLLDNTNEFAGAITPPTKGSKLFENYKQGSSNAGQYSMQLDADWEKLAGLKGFATHMVTVGRYGTTANRMFGDWMNHSSEDYGGGGNVVVHLVYAYGEETVLNGKLAIAAGRMAELSDFAASPLFCNFQNNSFCGRPKAITETNYVAGYPASTWGLRVRGRPVDHIYIQAGLYPIEDGIYRVVQHRTGFKFNGANIIGYAVPLEAAWEPSFAHGTLPGHYKIGGQAFRTNSPDTYYDDHHNPYVETGRPQKVHGVSWSVWAMFDQRFLTYKAKDSGLTGLWGAIYNDPRISLREYEVYGAILSRGMFYSRPHDTFGLGFSYTKIAPGVIRSERLLKANNKTLPYHATGIQYRTMILEVNYSIHVMRGVFFTPLFEYYFHPNGQHNLRDAAMLGFKSHVQIF